jgi:hypothetical protein
MLILFSIRLYQKYISPHKGFLCASNVLHKDGSCSGKISEIIKNSPIKSWKNLIKKQFDTCKNANITIKNEILSSNKDKNKRDKNKCNPLDWGEDACDVGSECGDCGDVGDCSP